MLARHLLFLATRRPNQALLVVQPNEQVSTAKCPPPLQQQQQQQQQHHEQPPQSQPHLAPPPYVGPPQVHKLHDERTTHRQQLRQNLPGLVASNNNNNNNNINLMNNNQEVYGQQHILNSKQQQQQRFAHDKRNPHYLHYSSNQNIYALQPPTQFYTLPSRRPQRDHVLEPARSITPDITRGLARAPLSSMHMLARQGQQCERLSPAYQQHQQQHQLHLNRKNLEQFEIKCKLAAAQQQQRQATQDVRNRFASPVGLSAFGYRLFTSPIQDGAPVESVPISPIGPQQTNGFQSSTPTSQLSGVRAAPTVAERLALQSQRCASPNPALLQAGSAPAPTSPNILLSPIKTTMSNEELFAAIHKSKRRLNIKDEPEGLSPAGSLASLHKQQQQHHHQVIGTRHSWSPESHKVPEIPKTAPAAVSATSRMDFKRLLLQQSVKSGPIRLSAAEQLKLSRQQCQEQQAAAVAPQTPTKSASQQQLAKVLSPRSAWRFQTPRTDVLSSTIIEDAAAEEKAMKPSPEAPAQADLGAARPGTRRQLNMASAEPPEAHRSSMEQLKNRINDSKSQQRSLEKCEKELENRLQLIDVKAHARAEVEADPVKAIENRRISNQLARAQFLASYDSAPVPPGKDLFGQRFRARSESPQQSGASKDKASDCLAVGGSTENPAVTRSPSAPALETAL